MAGATQWFNGPSSNPGRLIYTRTLTDGTVSVVDHEDAHTVTVDLPRLRFEKTATNVTTGQNPATQATPGDTLRYRIRIENLAANPVPDLDLRDELGRLNNAAVYVPGTLNLVTVPAGADASNTNASGGTNNSGLVDIRNLSLGGTGLLHRRRVRRAGRAGAAEPELRAEPGTGLHQRDRGCAQ